MGPRRRLSKEQASPSALPLHASMAFGGGPRRLPWGPSYLTLMVAFHGAVLLGRTELGLELSPVPFGVNLFAGHYLRLYDRPGATVRIFWPLRGGLGITGLEPVHFQLRADLVGVAFQVGHLLMELSLPRCATTPSSTLRTTTCRGCLAQPSPASSDRNSSKGGTMPVGLPRT
jgi:hypothetical protein